MGEEDVLRELLGDGAAALGDAAGPQVGHEGAEGASQVEAAVVEEAPVFHDQDGLDEMRGEVVEGNGPAIQVPAVLEGFDGFGREPGLAQAAAAFVAEGDDAVPAIRLDHQLEGSARRGGTRSLQVQASRVPSELAGPGSLGRGLAVPDPFESREQPGGLDVGARGEAMGTTLDRDGELERGQAKRQLDAGEERGAASQCDHADSQERTPPPRPPVLLPHHPEIGPPEPRPEADRREAPHPPGRLHLLHGR